MEEQKHSGFGIASFITSIVSGVLLFMTLMIAGVLESTTPGLLDEESGGAFLIGIFFIIILIAELIALGLGIGGIFQKERKKLYSILGTIISAAVIVIMVVLIFLGMALE